MKMTAEIAARTPAGLLPILLIAALSGCGSATTTPAGELLAEALRVEPRQANLPIRGTAEFRAIIQGAVASGVEWSASAGAITSTGFYTAPAEEGTYQIQARYGGMTGVATTRILAPGAPGALHAAASGTCAALPLRTTGVTRYFCECAAGAQPGCVAGDDASAGTTAASPRRSWAQVVSAFNSMNAGDTVALCQGGAWTVSTQASLRNARCAAAPDMKAAANTTTCDLRDYAPPWGGSAKPIVQQTANQIIFMFQSGAQRGVRILNLDLRGQGNGPGGGVEYNMQRGIVMQGENTDFLVCNNSFDGLYHAIHIMPDYTPGPARLVIWGNRFTDNSPEGILGIASHSTIDANFFDNNGSHNAMSHSIYLNGQNLTDVSFVNNELRRTGAPAPCQGVILVVHDGFDGLNVENNIVDGGAGALGGCWGIGIDHGGYPRATHFRNVTIRRNFLQNVGYAAISVGQAPAALIENNIIVSGMNGAGLGIHVPGVASRASPADDVTTAAVVRNNTVYFPPTAAGSTAISVGDIAEGSGHVIANNAVAFAGSGGTCLNLRLPPASYAYVDHNLCNGYQRWEASQGSLAAWQTFSGGRFDGRSKTSPPQFEAAPTRFVPADGSPLSGGGDGNQAPGFDFAFRQRPTPPSIGALER